MAGPKFWTSTVLLAFISLSGAAEPRRCYWCGPLAEQVHRSRRSAACRGGDPVTACEPGYGYCAVVATSPPRVESRLCVKVYQDECYPLYCNSTKTWKMTCPCRGDLCNGPNTDREKEAFALLPKLVAKTHNARIKKRTALPSPHIIKHKRIIDNSDSDDSDRNAHSEMIVNADEKPGQQPDNMQSDQPNIVEHHQEVDTQSVTNQDAQTTTSNTQLIEIEIHVSDPTVESDKMNVAQHPCTDSPSTTEADEPVKVTETVKQEDMPVTTAADAVVSNEATLKTSVNVIAKSEEPMETTKAFRTETIEVVTTEKAHPEPPMKTTEIARKEEPTKSVPLEDEMQNDAPIINPTNLPSQGTTEPGNPVDVTATKNSVKPSDGIPTAEALQQNGSSYPVTEKPIQATTTEATTVITVMTTQDNIVKITTPATKRKNSAVRITFSPVIILGFIIHL